MTGSGNNLVSGVSVFGHPFFESRLSHTLSGGGGKEEEGGVKSGGPLFFIFHFYVNVHLLFHDRTSFRPFLLHSSLMWFALLMSLLLIRVIIMHSELSLSLCLSPPFLGQKTPPTRPPSLHSAF